MRPLADKIIGLPPSRGDKVWWHVSPAVTPSLDNGGFKHEHLNRPETTSVAAVRRSMRKLLPKLTVK